MNLIERLQLATPAPHTTNFRVEQQDIYWIVYDADAPIAVVVRDTGVGGAMLDVLKFTPETANRPVKLPPYTYHYSTRLGHGASFNWSVDCMFQMPEQDAVEMLEATATRVVFLHTGEYYEGTKIACKLEIGYDAVIGQYSYDFTWDIDSTREVTGEFCNVFHRNLMHTDMQTREYDYGCFVRQGGSWEKYPITVLVTGLQQFRLINIPLEIGGGSGHMNRSGVVPMIIHRQANVPIIMGSCTTCFDLHQSAQVKAGMHTHIESRFVDMGRVIAAHPDELKMIDLEPIKAYPFHAGDVSSFDTPISAEQPWSGCIWYEWPGTQSSIADDCAHSGTRSMKLEAQADAPAMIYPFGPGLAFDNHTDYEVRLWVKIDGEAEASVELTAFLCTLANPTGKTTAAIMGTHDWTELVLRVNSGISDNGHLAFTLTGNGQAWFDDIVLSEVPKTDAVTVG